MRRSAETSELVGYKWLRPRRAVDEVQRPIGARSEIGIVRQDDEARSHGAIQLEHQQRPDHPDQRPRIMKVAVIEPANAPNMPGIAWAGNRDGRGNPSVRTIRAREGHVLFERVTY